MGQSEGGSGKGRKLRLDEEPREGDQVWEPVGGGGKRDQMRSWEGLAG